MPVPGATAPIVAAEFDGAPWVALKPMCDAIGVSYPAQYRKLTGRSWATVASKATVAADGKTRDMAMIDRRTLTMWLATIDENRVDSAAAPTIRAYQAQAADVLDAYFSHGGAIAPVNQYDALRAMIDQIEAAERTASEAKALSVDNEARIDAIEGQHGWYAALAYARLHGLNTSTQFLNRLGKQASLIAKAHDIAPQKVPHALFGTVNSYPEWIWDKAADGRAQ
ncbi:phage antirepressor [Nocardia cyriacigeorgica]|uniref:Phage antirepressor n=1 Tax=Nocardia cyriacigeorgica TaxID=135487 RepID=A0ABX0CEJ8_9NOCA|nr:phage antirepressor [Nocardia cyriacigeorgica]NEW53937.1 phage antirepressor [Nocardia cyriacigeorgica]NEW54474.1 phage antirepressor [Nocardia cyriacigeorgica]